jgi:hypothetical protein
LRRETRKQAKELEEEKLLRRAARRLKRQEKLRFEEERQKKAERKKGKKILKSDESSSSDDGDDDKSCQTNKSGNKKDSKGNKNDYGEVPLNFSVSIPNLDHISLVNVHAWKLPQFDGTNFAKWKHMMKTYLIGLHPELWEIVRSGMEEPQYPSSLTPLEYRSIHLNAQTTSALLSALNRDEYTK